MNLVYFFEQKLVTRHICVQDIDSQSFVVWRVENPTRHISVANLMRDELKWQLVTLQYVDYQKVKPLCDEWWVFRKNIFVQICYIYWFRLTGSPPAPDRGWLSPCRQKLSFCVVKDHILQSESIPFARQKTAFCQARFSSDFSWHSPLCLRKIWLKSAKQKYRPNPYARFGIKTPEGHASWRMPLRQTES